MFLVNFLSIHSAVCLEPALSVRGWICVTLKIMSRCSVTFVSHEYLQGPSHKENITWFDQKVKKNKIMMFLPIKVHLMGCWDGGHMTNYQK